MVRVIFHSADFDGVCSAAIILRSYPDAILHPINYGDDFDSIISAVGSDDIVYMVDFCIRPMKKMINLSSNCKQFIWIDHHWDAIKDAEDNKFQPLGIRRDGTAACVLTWEYFYGIESLPFSVDMIGRYDVYKLESSEYVLPFHFGMESHELDPKLTLWEKLFTHDKKTVDNIINSGRIILEYEKKIQIQDAMSYGFELTFGDYNVFVVNSPCLDMKFLSESGVYDPKRHHFFMSFVRKSKGWKFSLRTTRDDVNVSDIARLFKGGGHVKAAGFEVYDERFISNMLKGKLIVKSI